MRPENVIEKKKQEQAEREKQIEKSLGLRDIGISVDTDKTELVNDGQKAATITVTATEIESNEEANLVITGDSYPITLYPNKPYTDVLTTTRDAGSTITVRVTGEFVEPEPATIEVVSQ